LATNGNRFGFQKQNAIYCRERGGWIIVDDRPVTVVMATRQIARRDRTSRSNARRESPCVAIPLDGPPRTPIGLT
jgi:hypothetical protein